MKRNIAIMLQLLTVLIAIGAAAFLLWEPTVEGVNAGAAFSQIYFDDPFLAFVYAGSIPFFVILYQTFKALGYAVQDSPSAKKIGCALRTIRHCALGLIGLVLIGEVIIRTNESDDRAGGMAMGLFVIAGLLMIAAVATKLERNQ
jgi:hypothetical protein